MASEPNGVDNVNHPAHYTGHVSGMECIDVVQFMSFMHGSAFKYIWRWREKGGVESLEKALWYLKRGAGASPMRKGLDAQELYVLDASLAQLAENAAVPEELQLIAQYYNTGDDSYLIDLCILLAKLIDKEKK